MKKNVLPTDWYKFAYLTTDQLDEFAALIAPTISWLPDRFTMFTYGLQNKYLKTMAVLGLLNNQSNFNFCCVVAFTAAMLDRDPGLCQDIEFKTSLDMFIHHCLDTENISDGHHLRELIISQALHIKPALVKE